MRFFVGDLIRDSYLGSIGFVIVVDSTNTVIAWTMRTIPSTHFIMHYDSDIIDMIETYMVINRVKR